MGLGAGNTSREEGLLLRDCFASLEDFRKHHGIKGWRKILQICGNSPATGRAQIFSDIRRSTDFPIWKS